MKTGESSRSHREDGIVVGGDGACSDGPAVHPIECLPPSVLSVWRIESALGAVLAAAATVVVFAIWPRLGQGSLVEITLIGLVLAAGLLDLTLLVPRRHARYSFEVLPAVVRMERGALIYASTTIPLDKIIYVQISRGPLLKAYGLASVKLGTIGDPITLGPILHGRAEQVQTEIGVDCGREVR